MRVMPLSRITMSAKLLGIEQLLDGDSRTQTRSKSLESQGLKASDTEKPWVDQPSAIRVIRVTKITNTMAHS